jgi:hypothetical protein
LVRYEGTRGVAYGGPDLSHRNLEALRTFREIAARESIHPLPLSATGNIDSGARAAEYLLVGASSFQMHTLFQLPDSEFAMRVGSKTERALHRLLFDPEHGFIRRFLELRDTYGWKAEWSVADCARTALRAGQNGTRGA